MHTRLIQINLFFFLLLLEILLPYIFREFNIMTLSRYSIINQDEFKLKSSNTLYNYSDKFNQNFFTLIKDDFSDIKIENYTIETATQIRERLLNLGEKRNGNYLITRYSDEIYKHLKSNKPLLCGEIARLYGHILNLYGFNVRYITVARSLFDAYDRHSTIEIWDDQRQKWIISDPTFNVSFKCDTIYLSSDELYDLIHSGNFDLITITHGKPTKYETSLNHYYISYYSLFDNIYYIKNIEPFSIKDLPPIRWFNNNYKTYLVQTFEFPVRSSSIKIQNSIMFFILLLNPTLIILMFFNMAYPILKHKLRI